MVITNFAEAHEALRRFYGKHAEGPYTLERMRSMMSYLGDPQDELQIIHVAGTSGKTSTAYYIASLLQTAGFKVGLTVSPHVDEVNERVQLYCVPLKEEQFCRELSKFLELIESNGLTPSYFECMVAFAYWEFARQKVDYAVVEVGLGGLLDGTNVVDRPDKVCVITDIGLDHTELLGDTVEKIAAQKAGIIQPGNQVFMGRQADEIMEVVRSVCEAQGAELYEVELEELAPMNGPPAFQRRNFELADEVVDWVLRGIGRNRLSIKQLQEASKVYIPARMEIIQDADKYIVIDGAHNSQKLTTLLASIREKFGTQDIAALIGFVSGDKKRMQQAIEVLATEMSHMVITGFYTEKDYPKHSADPQDVRNYCDEIGFSSTEIVQDSADALKQLLGRPERVVVVTGSFYLLNHIRPMLLTDS